MTLHSEIPVVNLSDFWAHGLKSNPGDAGRAAGTRTWNCLTRLYAHMVADGTSNYDYVSLVFQQGVQTDPATGERHCRPNDLMDLELPSLRTFVDTVQSRTLHDPVPDYLGRGYGIGTLRFMSAVALEAERRYG
jgi:hypothetical protein